MPDSIAKLASIAIDCPDADALAPFYQRLLGLNEAFATPDRSVIALSGAGPMVTLMQTGAYTAPDWPDGPQHQQLHFDLASDDLDADVAAAVRIGAVEAAHQPAPESWRVMLDPVGHPFCLTTVRPD